MAITDPLLLSPGVILVPVAELPEALRQGLDPKEGDWALTHAKVPAPSRLVDSPSAELLREFRTPSTIAEAVIRFSQARDADPESTLVAAYPLLERMLAAGFLVPEGSGEAGGLAVRAGALLARILGQVALDGPLLRDGLPVPPRASVSYGAAGIACGLYRMAMARDDAEVLSLADRWAARAAAETGEEAFYRPGSRINPDFVGRVSPYHTASGVHAARALIARARGDAPSHRAALDAFLAAVRAAPCPNPDLTLGRSGILLAAALLAGPLDPAPAALIELGDGLLAGLWEEIGALPPIPRCPQRPNLGVAHGWAGYLYATLLWCRAAGRPLPPALGGRLAELAETARPWGRGLRWRWYSESGGDGGSMPGWCNGSAGFVFLWTLAHRTLGDPRWGELAEGAAWNAWEAPDSHGSLCCGLAGRAYALLNFHRHGGGPEWLERARELAERAAGTIEHSPDAPHNLYKGALGVAVLAADLARPESAAFPFFEDERVRALAEGDAWMLERTD